MSEETILLPAEVRERLLATISSRLPRKSFGYLISRGNPRVVEDFLLLEGNTRNSVEWKGKFEAYGQYFLEHDDAGFVATPEETWRLQKEMWKRDMVEVGIFHSHLRHPANFSLIDYDMHIQRYKHLWHMIIAVRKAEMPQVRIFDVSDEGVFEQRVVDERGAVPAMEEGFADLALDEEGRPVCKDALALVRTITALREGGDERVIEEALTRGFLRGAEERYERHVAAGMREVSGGRFVMGTKPEEKRHYVGETPAHEIEVGTFMMGSHVVTNAMYGLLDPSRLALGADELEKPVVDVSWYEATLFAWWMGCRLPAEAEWEFACGAGSAGEWACVEESALPGLAWFSENSHGVVQRVGTREANRLGLHDLHGNVWEWCEDAYHEESYAQRHGADVVGLREDKVCRGGSVHALSEMCRTRYRMHEPPAFSAHDLGFRMVQGGLNG